MASVTESLFGSLFQTPGQAQAQAVQQAYQPVSDGMGMFLGQIRGTGEELRQGIGRTFGQEPVADQQKRKLQAIVQATQQQVDVGTPEGLAKLAENLNQFPEFSGIALALRQQAAQTAQEGQLKQAQIGKYEAEAAKAKVEKRVPLADRLVELETKQATTGLNPAESAEKKALERVVKIQAPKGVDLSGLAAVLGKEASEEEGKEIGKRLGQIQGKQEAVDSLKEARKILEQGIYTGSYGEFQKELAKKTLGVVGDPKRVENTEVFLNLASSNVIPLLKEFGGNDSNEELKFLQRVVGGDITLEQGALKRILDNAIVKIERGIQRTIREGKAVRKGEAPPLPEETKKETKRKTKSGIEYSVQGE